MDRKIVAGPRAHGKGDAHQLAAAMERPQPYGARQPGKVVEITEVGAPLNASIRSGAGFGTLVMAVVMLMQIVSPWVGLFCHYAGQRR